MKIKTVYRNWIAVEDYRLSATPYQSLAFESRRVLGLLNTTPLNKLTKQGKRSIFSGPRFARSYVTSPEHGVPLLSGSDILQADLSTTPLVSRRLVEAMPEMILREGTVLITSHGTVGRIAYVRPDMQSMIASDNIMKVILDKEKILPGYVYAFLQGRFGLPMVTIGATGGTVQFLPPDRLYDLPVPRLGDAVEQRAHALVEEAAQALSIYQKLIEEATSLIFHITGIPNPRRHEWYADRSDLGFVINRSELEILRAWNHSVRAQNLRRCIQKGNWSRLGDITEFEWMRWRKMFARIDTEPEFGIEVITQKPLFHLFPEGRWISRKYLLEHSPKYIVPDETILIAKQGTLGENELYCRCEFITGNRMLSRAYSDHCMRIVVSHNAIHPGYLFAFLRSETAFRLLRSLSEGAKQQDLHWRTVPNLPIPRCTPEQEHYIGEKVRQAYEKRNLAVANYTEARELVEQAIEEAA